MSARARIFAAVMLAVAALSSCKDIKEEERLLTEQCKKEESCKKQGICTGRCTSGPCACVVGGDADCLASTMCAASGACTLQGTKCAVVSNTDCTHATPCKASGICTAKDGMCVVGSDADCKQSDLCKDQNRCAAKNGACIDASFNPALLNPALVNEQPPPKWKVKFATTKGDFVVEFTTAWAPFAAERLYTLVKIGYYTNVAIYRVDASTAEIGINGRPDVTAVWRESPLVDEPPKQPNERGYVALAKTGPKTSWAPFIVHLKNNREMAQGGYAPIGKVVDGMAVFDSLAKTTDAEMAKVVLMGDAYLKTLPKLEYVKSATLL
jgi:peptidyl-prolyl cis-trans isomerase A (cyclophilin A)